MMGRLWIRNEHGRQRYRFNGSLAPLAQSAVMSILVAMPSDPPFHSIATPHCGRIRFAVWPLCPSLGKAAFAEQLPPGLRAFGGASCANVMQPSLPVTGADCGALVAEDEATGKAQIMRSVQYVHVLR